MPKKVTKKGELLDKVRSLPDFKKSWERKTCEELRYILSASPTVTTAVVPSAAVDVVVEESGTISPIRIADYVYEEHNRMDLKEAILRAFSDAPFDDTVYPRIQKKVLTF
jgi:hypothetical protein